MTIIDEQKKFKEGLIGKTVFFMCENRIVKTKIDGFDEFQLFSLKSHAIQNGKQFFFSLQELLDYLEDSVDDSEMRI